MRTDQILSADLLDIVFENRNKNYGAYNLRKFYSNRLGMALGVTFLMAASAFVALKFVKINKPLVARIEVEDPYMIKIHEIEPTTLPVKPKIEVPKQKATVKVPAQKFVQNIIITKDEKNATALAKNLDSVAISDATHAGDPGEKLLVKGPVAGKETTKDIPVAPAAVDKVTPMAVAEVMPSFPGGMDGLRKFLQKNLRNPEDMESGELVSVKIKFVVGYDGKLQSFQTVEDGGSLFNNEVMRVLRKMPDWIPGKSRGENVSVYYTIPVKFTGAD